MTRPKYLSTPPAADSAFAVPGGGPQPGPVSPWALFRTLLPIWPLLILALTLGLYLAILVPRLVWLDEKTGSWRAIFISGETGRFI